MRKQLIQLSAVVCMGAALFLSAGQPQDTAKPLPAETKQTVVTMDDFVVLENQLVYWEGQGYRYAASEIEPFQESKEGIYNYCPSVIREDYGMSVFYCSNVNDYTISDHICMRDIILHGEDVLYGPKLDVLAPSASGWDSVHVCDPSVIEGNFMYQNEEYRYLMAYLGCDTLNGQRNQIGLAVSNSLSDRWVKLQDINPIIRHNYNWKRTDAFQWGVGQPSILHLGEGVVAVFYTEGTVDLTSTKCQIWDLHNLDAPVLLSSFPVSNAGTNDFISNADFAYSMEEEMLYMVCDRHPFSGTILSNISDSAPVYRTKVSLFDLESLSGCVWEYIGGIDSSISGYQKNHNNGLMRDGNGFFADREVLVTNAGEMWDFNSSLWTYRIRRYGF